MDEIIVPARVMRKLVETLSSDIGRETLSVVLSNVGLLKEWASPAHFGTLDDARIAQVYSRLLSALRTYYVTIGD